MHDKMMWFNNNIQYMFHANIVEYDMVAASVSICERFKLLKPEMIEQLKLLPKQDRTRRMGLLQRDDKEFSEQLLSGIREIRRKFLEANNLDERNVLSLHSDAIIFNSKKKIISDIEGVRFSHKNTWNAYLRMDKKEMFYSEDNEGNSFIEFKGIPENLINQHTIGLNKYIRTVFSYLENYNPKVLSYISNFQMKYLQDKLPVYYYEPFGKIGNYKTSNFEVLSLIANVVVKEVRSWNLRE